MKQGSTYTVQVKHLGNKTKTIKPPLVEVIVEEPDFKKAQSFQNDLPNEEAKVELELYAREFKVELKRSQSFKNMLKDFKEQYNGS